MKNRISIGPNLNENKELSKEKFNTYKKEELSQSQTSSMRCKIFNSTKLMVLFILCLQNSIYTVLRRYSQGVLKEEYSKHEVLLVAELIKFIFSIFMISFSLNSGQQQQQQQQHHHHQKLGARVIFLLRSSGKMFFLACMYGIMNILSFIALRNIDAGTFTIFAQLKILTTATFSKLMLDRKYSVAKWRALVELILGALLFSSHIFSTEDDNTTATSSTTKTTANQLLGILAVITEVTTSGFASIYFEKVIKTSKDNLTIWERNLQLAFGSIIIYLAFILYHKGETVGYGGGWTQITLILSVLGAAGGFLVALSIQHADAILKTLSTTGAIILSSILDHMFMGGPLTSVMILASGVVILSICNYTFDATPPSLVGAGTSSKCKIKNIVPSGIDHTEGEDKSLTRIERHV